MTQGKKPKKITAQYLERAAFHYLGRFSSSSANLRRIMERKIWSRVNKGADRPDDVDVWLDELIAKCVRMGLVDDSQYALSRAKNFLAKGRGISRIKAELRHKGIDEDVIAQTINEINPEGNADLDAAFRLAKKKRLGNFSSKVPEDNEEREKLRKKHLGVLARAGFSFGIAKQVLDFEDNVE